ncbi:MAG: hypothetical protein ACJ73Y_06135 [Rubrobacteraceae bacterium]
MLNDRCYVRLWDRTVRERELDELRRERRRQTLTAGKPSLRALMARRLFALAVATEREETWRVVWERLEAKGGL